MSICLIRNRLYLNLLYHGRNRARYTVNQYTIDGHLMFIRFYRFSIGLQYWYKNPLQ